MAVAVEEEEQPLLPLPLPLLQLLPQLLALRLLLVAEPSLNMANAVVSGELLHLYRNFLLIASGFSWTGATGCAAPYTCNVINDYVSCPQELYSRI